MRILSSLVLVGSVLIAACAALERRSIVQPSGALKQSEIEGSGKAEFGSPSGPDQEEIRPFHGSGYPSDDEDGDDEPANQDTVVEGSGAPVWSTIPGLTTTTTTTVSSIEPRRPDTVSEPHDHVVDEEHDAVHHEVFSNQLTTSPPNIFYPESPVLPQTTATLATTSTTMKMLTTRRPQPTPKPKSETPPEKPSDEATPFYALYQPGLFAIVVGSFVIGLLATVFIIVFIVYRMRKKDEGSYALDEPKTRPYAGYAYTKASTKEFYA